MLTHSNIDPRPLFVRETTGRYRPALFDELRAATAAAAYAQLNGTPVLQSPRIVREYLRAAVGALDFEVFGLVWLNNRHRVVAVEELFRGTIDGASVHPREVVRSAIQRGAAAVILYHNHPSGVTDPSCADELITNRIREALALIEVRVLDHLILTRDSITSFAELGKL